MIATVGRNILANVAGTGLGVLAFLVVVPVYLRVLGAEGFGLVGLLTTLTIAAAALDLGLGATMNREAARMTAQPGDSGRLADVAATLPAASWAVGIGVGALFVSLAPAITSRWLTFSALSVSEVRTALGLMGAVLPALVVRGVYVGALNGLQRQGTVNVVQVSSIVMRGGASIAALLAVAPTATVFLVVQLILLYAEVGVLAAALRRSLPLAARRGRIRVEAIRPLLPFSAGMAGTMLLGLALTSMDQIILSAVLPLAEFGYYTLAVSVAAALGQIVGPVTTAVFPRFSQLFERREDRAAVAEYHFFSQVVAIVVLPLAALLVFFPTEVLTVWTRDTRLAHDAAPVLSLRAIGTVLNALLHVPHVVQLASGWSTLGAGVNATAALAMAPVIVIMSLRWGGAGAALAWAVLNLGVFILFMRRMHQRIWPGALTSWYAHILRPTAAVAVVGALARVTMPATLGTPARLGWLTTTGVLAAAAALSVASTVRRRVVAALRAS